jgi:hypothetical protein
MPKERYSPTAICLSGAGTQMSNTNITSWANGIRTNNYGFLFFYDLQSGDFSDRFTAASTALYGESVEATTLYKHWSEP